MAWTKEQRAEYMKRYREEHRPQLRKNRRYYYSRHKETEKSYHNQWIENNKERWNAYQREYRKRKKQEACTTDNSDCSACEYAYHDNNYNECAVDGVKPLERRDNESSID